ncbi:fimbrial protein [Enterobacter ludwigii]|nr:fimbrial protein [Enterobacter ludwigii]
MNIKHMAYGMILIGASGMNTALGRPPPPEIGLKYTGSLVAEPCVIEPGYEDIVLDFGSIIDRYLYLNTRTLSKPFEIRLADCDLSIGKTVSVTFRGAESVELPGLLGVDSSSEAKGIAIGLETTEAKPLAFNKESDKFTLQAGNSRIALKAYVQGEPAALRNKSITRGPFSAVATFRLEYE